MIMDIFYAVVVSVILICIAGIGSTLDDLLEECKKIREELSKISYRMPK